MSRELINSGSGGNGGARDYGATGTTSSTSNVPDVNFAGFSPTEFMSLCEYIAQNIGFVKTSWQSLDKAYKVLGTAKDNKPLRDKIHQIQTTTNQKIQSTSKDLQRLSVVVRRGNKQQKLQVEKLTSDFKNVVEIYSSRQQQIATKMKVALLNSSINDDIIRDSAESTNNNPEALQQRQKMIENDLQFEHTMMLEREQRVKQIEADVLDVNQIMRELSSLVNQQGENIDTIENSVDHAANDVEAGTSELQKAIQSQTKYRRKVLILLIIAVIIGIIVTSIIVSQLKS